MSDRSSMLRGERRQTQAQKQSNVCDRRDEQDIQTRNGRTRVIECSGNVRIIKVILAELLDDIIDSIF
jgi:hypothetical protein